MAKFKAKAEQMFEEKVQYFMSRNSWDHVEEVTRQYEAYLKLVEPMCSYEVQHTDEVGSIDICIIHGQNSRHTSSKDQHRPCLTVDPYPPVEKIEAHPSTSEEMEEYVKVYAGKPKKRGFRFKPLSWRKRFIPFGVENLADP